jgi:uncharacterized phosphosugar-binding protein
MPSLVETYRDRAHNLLAAAWTANEPTIAKLAPLVGASVARGEVIHTFGSGHSELISREIIGRAGGLVCVSGIIDPTNGFIENLPGYGTRLVERYDRQHELRRGEVIIVISNSGKNGSPIDVALYAKNKGLTVVALTCLAMSKVTPSQHPNGKRLFEVADYVLDNGGVPGDAIVEVPSLRAANADPAAGSLKAGAPAEASAKAGPTSTLIGCSVLNWLSLSTIEWLVAHGNQPPLLRSQNLPGAIEYNRELGRRYAGRLSRQLA